MTTKLEKPLKREISVDGKPFIATLTPEGLKLTAKGHRKGRELTWKSLLEGDANLASSLHAPAEVSGDEGDDTDD